VIRLRPRSPALLDRPDRRRGQLRLRRRRAQPDGEADSERVAAARRGRAGRIAVMKLHSATVARQQHALIFEVAVPATIQRTGRRPHPFLSEQADYKGRK
jgi:hypothetical protein